jgi:tRNA pseudouridine55 synthase
MRKTRTQTLSGIAFLDKASGITSFGALNEIKKQIKSGKAGPTGTLDKFASGLLIVLTGNALKLSSIFTNCDKKYTARICFGTQTDTLDPEGKIIAKASLPELVDIEKALENFTGEIWQKPPNYSAIHINGKRASDLAREGADFEIKERKVIIHNIELIDYQKPFATINVHCSSGTYIRSLARDIAENCNSCAYVENLRRTQIANFELEKFAAKFSNFPIPINKSIFILSRIPYVEIEEKQLKAIYKREPLSVLDLNYCILSGTANKINYNNYKNDFKILAIFYMDFLIAVIEKKENTWKYKYVDTNY